MQKFQTVQMVAQNRILSRRFKTHHLIELENNIHISSLIVKAEVVKMTVIGLKRPKSETLRRFAVFMRILKFRILP